MEATTRANGARKLTPGKIERLFGIGEGLIRGAIMRGELPALEINSRYLIDPDDFRAFLAARRIGPSLPASPTQPEILA